MLCFYILELVHFKQIICFSIKQEMIFMVDVLRSTFLAN